MYWHSNAGDNVCKLCDIQLVRVCHRLQLHYVERTLSHVTVGLAWNAPLASFIKVLISPVHYIFEKTI